MSDTGRPPNNVPNMQNLSINSPEAARIKAAFKDELQTILAVKPNTRDAIVREWIRTEFNLPDSMRAKCDEFFLRVWEGSYVLNQVVDGKMVRNIQAYRDDTGEWIVYWQSTPEVVRYSSRVACSFRLYEGVRYVVIKVWKGEEE